MSYRLLQAICFTTCLLLAPAIGAAEGDSQPPKGEKTSARGAPEPTEEAKKEAGQRFQRGLSFYEDGDYGLALIEFERAYQLVPDYRVLYNIGQVSIQLSRSSQALRALREYLDKGGDALSPERVEAVTRDLEMLHARTAHLVLEGTEGAEVIIDDESYGILPLDAPLLVDAGRRKIEVKKEGFREYSDRLTLAGAEERRITVELEQRPTQSPVVARVPDFKREAEQPPKADDAVSPSKQSVPFALIGWSATGALTGGAIVSGVMGLSASKKLRNLKSEPDPARSDLQDQAKATKTWFAAADILTVAAIATGGVSLYFSLRGRPGSERAKVSLEEGSSADIQLGLLPRAVSVSGRF